MVNAVLHVICGNCGNGDPDMMEVRTYPGDEDDPTCAAIACKNCTTLHFLDGDKFRHQDHRQTDSLRARIAELEAERAERVKDRERLDWLAANWYRSNASRTSLSDALYPLLSASSLAKAHAWASRFVANVALSDVP